MIIIEPVGGLCNRLRVIVSSYEAAVKHGTKLFVVWRNTDNCNCSYNELFSLPDFIRTLVVPNRWLPNKIINQLIKIQFNRVHFDEDVCEWLNQGKTDIILDNMKKTYLRTCEAIYGSWNLSRYNFSIIAPNKEILEQVPAIIREKKMIGVHVRRTDSTQSIMKSPVEAFLKKMDLEIDRNRNTVFFLASDDEDIKNKFIERYGQSHVYTRNGISFSRSSSRGIKDAYVDLLCLSHCQKIYGSYWSSFSECASAMGKIPLVICTD